MKHAPMPKSDAASLLLIAAKTALAELIRFRDRRIIADTQGRYMLTEAISAVETGYTMREHTRIMNITGDDPASKPPQPGPDKVKEAEDAAAVAENLLEEIADGAWGDDPKLKGLARDRLTALRAV